jgi:hypothetical protein
VKALTLIRPWGWACFNGKPVENRKWAPPIPMIGQYIAIHQGKKWSDEAADDIADILEIDELPPESADEGIIGLARIDRVISMSPLWYNDPVRKSIWYTGPFGWVLTDHIYLPRAVPCRGALGLWAVPESVLAELREQVAA